MIRNRIPSIDDATISRIIVRELLPFNKKSNPSPSLQMNMKAIKQRLNRNVTFVVAKGRRPPIGFITVICRKRVLFVDMLAMDSRHHGRGWGKALMEAAEKYGRSKGCDAVQLFVDDSNYKAYGFYQSRGYNLLQFVKKIHCYLMSKPL